MIVAVLVVTFAMLQLVPGNVVNVITGPSTPPSVARQLAHELGLDRPLPVQFWNYVTGLLHGQLGTSYVSQQPVSQIIGEHLPATLELTGLGVLIGVTLAIPLGMFAAMRSYAKGRNSGLGFTFSMTICASTPDFLLGTILAFLFAVTLQLFPVAGDTSWDSIILPALALGIPLAGIQSRVVRASTLTALSQPFGRTLRAAGVSERRVLLASVLPNASIPLITLLSVDFGRLLAGALVVENVFAWPGLGTVIFDSINNRDIPAVQSEILVLAAIIVLVNLVVDILYRVIDPRIGQT